MGQALLKKIYGSLPVGLRGIPASLWGYRLQALRYGPETARLAEEAIERESWSADRWRRWQEQRLAETLSRAAAQVPYYREHWARRRAAGDRSSVERLESWPVLEKEVVRSRPEALLADDANRRRLHDVSTSGTTSTPLKLYRSLASSKAWYALFEARCRGWNGVSKDMRWGMLGGQTIVPPTSTEPPFWLWNAGMRQLYVSTYHLAPDLAPHILDELARRRVEYLIGYSSSLYLLARGALRAGRSDVRLRTVITNAEPLHDYQRQTIDEAFGCVTRESYGMAEMVTGASECERGALHLWPEAGVTEVAGPDGIQSAGAGELICTGLLNDAMPLIRYRVGDRGALPEKPWTCACGRTLPSIERVEGRTADMIVTRDGRRIFSVNPVFRGLPVIEAQIVQETASTLLVRIATEAQDTDALFATVRTRLRERLGRMEIQFERADRIPRTGAKYRQVICKLSQEEIEALEESRLSVASG